MTSTRDSFEPGSALTARSQSKVALPARYQNWMADFDRILEPELKLGVRILDVGSGRRPALAIDRRPENCQYVGLDISRSELMLAPDKSYDEIWVSDIMNHVPELENRFDLIMSWQVFEHVKQLDKAMDNLQSYLRPGGRLVSQLSGTFSMFGVINMVVPQRFGVWTMHKLLRRNPDTVFPAYYDKCWHGALDRLLVDWTFAEVIPRYAGAPYFRFWTLLQRLYLSYEEWCQRKGHKNLATHYIINAVR